MSLLTVIQEVTRRIGSINVPSAIVSSTDTQIIQLLAIANEEGEVLSERHRWKALVNEATLATVATESQGSITTIASGYKWLMDQTMFNRTLKRRIMPVSDTEWQSIKANGITGPFTRFRLRGSSLLFTPIPTAGQTVTFEYVSKNWCQSSTGTGQVQWTNDTDTGVLDEQLMVSGIIWRWKQSKGLDYADDFNKYETRVANAMARDTPVRSLNMNARNGQRFISSTNVAEGSW